MCLHWKSLYLRQLHRMCQTQNEPHPASPVPKGPSFYSVWVKREAGYIMQRQRDRGIEIRGRILKIIQIKKTDLMTEIETVIYFRDRLSRWWMVWNSPSDRSIKWGSIQWITQAWPQLYKFADLCRIRMCTCACVCVHTYNTHTHKMPCSEGHITSQDSLKTDRTCMSKSSINIFACCRYVLLAYKFFS